MFIIEVSNFIKDNKLIFKNIFKNNGIAMVSVPEYKMKFAYNQFFVFDLLLIGADFELYFSF